MGVAARLPGAPWAPAGVDAWPAPWQVHHVDETGSTNADLLAVAATAPDRSVLVTDHQTAGRGRLDRRWDAPAGTNLLVSFLFRDPDADPNGLVRRLAIATATACRLAGGADVRLKWPNDLLLDDAKLAGILAQRASSGEVVVGLGLNVGWAPEGAARLGDEVAVPALLAAILDAYDRLPTATDELTASYRELLDTLGRRVRVQLPDADLTGTAIDVEPDGRLVVLDECAVTHRLDAGDVVHLRGR